MSFQHLVDLVNSQAREERSRYHLTLGQAIDKLSNYPADKKCFWKLLDDKYWYGINAEVFSYRGYYSDLSISYYSPLTDDAATVEELLDVLKKTLNTELTGYKGGEFLMDAGTPLWISNYGNAFDVAPLDIYEEKEGVVFLCKVAE